MTAGDLVAADLPVADLLALAEDVAREAGRLIVDGRPADLRVAATKSSPTDVVTEMDRASEDLLRTRLAQARPDDGLHGEEGGLQAGTSGVTWLVDPIDGTVNYLYGIPVYAVSVAAVVGDTTTPGAWRPVATRQTSTAELPSRRMSRTRGSRSATTRAWHARRRAR